MTPPSHSSHTHTHTPPRTPPLPPLGHTPSLPSLPPSSPPGFAANAAGFYFSFTFLCIWSGLARPAFGLAMFSHTKEAFLELVTEVPF
eukprot:1508606-Rhodomonas_salina.1